MMFGPGHPSAREWICGDCDRGDCPLCEGDPCACGDEVHDVPWGGGR